MFIRCLKQEFINSHVALLYRIMQEPDNHAYL